MAENVASDKHRANIDPDFGHFKIDWIWGRVQIRPQRDSELVNVANAEARWGLDPVSGYRLKAEHGSDSLVDARDLGSSVDQAQPVPRKRNWSALTAASSELVGAYLDLDVDKRAVDGIDGSPNPRVFEAVRNGWLSSVE